MLTKEALEKVAAADARDHAAAIEAGFEDACADMGLSRPVAEGLAKVARARLAEFRKVAAEMVPARPPAVVTEGAPPVVPNYPFVNPEPQPLKPGNRIGNVGAPKAALPPVLKPWAPPVPVPPMVTIPPKQPAAPTAVAAK